MRIISASEPTPATPVEWASADTAAAFAGAVAAASQALLGPRLCGAYLIGSLAHGGFSPRYSDIDMALIAGDGIAEAALAQIRAEGAGIAAALAPKLSLFWTDRTFAKGRFPPLDRCDYLDHAVALIEHERIVPSRPALADIRAYLGGPPFANWAENARRFSDLPALEDKDHKAYLRALIYPARLLYSWSTGRMGSNDAAVAWLRQQNWPGIDVGLAEEALECRRGGRDPVALFPARGTLLAQVAACRSLIA